MTVLRYNIQNSLQESFPSRNVGKFIKKFIISGLVKIQDCELHFYAHVGKPSGTVE